MAGEKTTRIVLDLDNKQFVQKVKDSTGLLKDMTNTDSVQSFGEALAGIGEIAGIVGVAFLALKTSMDLTVEGERIAQINQAFNAMAGNVGLAADAIKDQLVTAAHGLASETDILQAANKAIESMGENAKLIPQTMEFARQATHLFGGELIQNFEALNQALAAGNVRALRQFGIIVDITKAHKDYAQQLGISVEFLTDQGKRQAVVNAALEQAKQKFSGVDETLTPVTDKLKQQSVAWTELREAAAKAWDKIAGDSTAKSTESTTTLIHQLANQIKEWFGSAEEKAAVTAENMEILTKKIQKQRALMAEGGASAEELKPYDDKLAEIAAKQDRINQLDERHIELQMHKAQVASQIDKGPKAGVAANPDIDNQKLLDARNKFEKQLDEISLRRYQTDEQYAQSEDQATTAEFEKEVAMTKDNEAKKRELTKQAKDLGLLDSAEYKQAIENMDAELDTKLINSANEVRAARIKALDNYAAHTKDVNSGIEASFKSQGLQAQSDFKNMQVQGKVVFGALKNNASDAFKSIGDGSKNAGEAMRGFMLGAIADIAESEGQYLLAMGIGTFDPVAIAEGGVLIALSSALRSAAGGKGSSGISGGGGGGGSSSGGGGTVPDNSSQVPPDVQAAHKALTINFMGDYNDSEQSRTRFMDIIRQSGDFTDFNINRIGPQ